MEKKNNLTLLGWGTKRILHLTADGHELDHPMILPVTRIPHQVHIILRVVQFDNFHFLPRNFSSSC
jgi:hypothetical protein